MKNESSKEMEEETSPSIWCIRTFARPDRTLISPSSRSGGGIITRGFRVHHPRRLETGGVNLGLIPYLWNHPRHFPASAHRQP